MFKKSKKTGQEKPETIKDAIAEMTSPENIDVLEGQLKEEHGVATTKEKSFVQKAGDIIANLKKDAEEFSKVVSGGDELVTEEAIGKKLDELEERAVKLDAKIANIEQTLKKRVHSGIVYNHWN